MDATQSDFRNATAAMIHHAANRLIWPGKQWFAGLVLFLSISLTPFWPNQTNGQILSSFTEPIISSELAFSENGIVRKIHVKEGDYVAKGTIIGELDLAVLRRSLLLAQARAQSMAGINAAKATLKLRRQRHESLEQLDRNGQANKSELLMSAAELEQAQAELDRVYEERTIAELEVERINAQLEQRVIRSPFKGQIVEIHRQLGEYFSNSEAQFATVVELSSLKTRFYLRYDQLQKLSLGQMVSVILNGERVDAKITYISSIVDPDSRTSRVEIMIDNPDYRYTSGMACRWGTPLPDSSRLSHQTSGIDLLKNASPNLHEK